MSCSCPAAVTSSRIGTASVGLRRNGTILSFQVNMQCFKAQKCWGLLVPGTLERNYWKCRCYWEVWGEKPPFLGPVCLLSQASPAFIFLKWAYLLFCYLTHSILFYFWPFLPHLSQSKHLATGNKFWSWFCSNTVLVLHDTHLHCFCLVLLSTGSTFFFKQIGLSLVSVIH